MKSQPKWPSMHLSWQGLAAFSWQPRPGRARCGRL